MDRLTAKLGDVLLEADAREASRDARAESCRSPFLITHRVAQNLSHLFLGASMVLSGAPLKLGLHIIL